MRVTVYASPREVRPTVLKGASVVLVDVFGAASAAAAFLSHGAEAVQLHPDPASARRAYARAKRGTSVLAGERGFEKIPGFHLAGLAAASSREKVKGRTVHLVSPLARALPSLREAAGVYLGSFLNLSAVYDALLRSRADLVVVQAGEEQGAEIPVDAVFSGQIVDFLQNTVGGPPLELSESARRAVEAYRPWQGRLGELLRRSPRAAEFLKRRSPRELDLLARLNRLDAVPVLRGGMFVREAPPKPRKPGSEAARPAAPQKGKAIKVKVPLFPKNPEHPVPEAALEKTKLVPTPEVAAKLKKVPPKKAALFGKNTVATPLEKAGDVQGVLNALRSALPRRDASPPLAPGKAAGKASAKAPPKAAASAPKGSAPSKKPALPAKKAALPSARRSAVPSASRKSAAPTGKDKKK